MINAGLERERVLGVHRLATETIAIPPERAAIAEIQANVKHAGWSAVREASELNLLRPSIRHAELSPTYRCPEDCGGCPDRASLHLGDPLERQLNKDEWFGIVDRLHDIGVEYFLLIGGTIDRHPITPQLMAYIPRKGKPADVGWFTDGIMLQNPHTGQPTPILSRLMREGGMRNISTHVSADYVVPQGVEKDGPILDPRIRWENEYGGSRYYKSAYGERLARRLVELGARRVVLNTAISAHNIDEVLNIYSYAVELQEEAERLATGTVVLYTVSPWIWRPHLARGDEPGNYDATTLLRAEHIPKLEEISRVLLEDTRERLQSGKPRVAGNSSGYLAGLPYFAVTQDIGYPHGSGELAVQPDGTVRIDSVFMSAQSLLFARNPYGYRDRDIDHPPFAHYNLFPWVRTTFPNLIQTTRGDVQWR